jgi:oxygen-independent coproporphyrinogen-3 oxidase
VREKVSHDQFTEAYLTELDFFKDVLAGKDIISIFFGGGTPSLMPPKTVETIISHLSKISNIRKDAEITLEANPTSVEAANFKTLKEVGINRVSLGVQSFKDTDLKFLGREHSSNEAKKAIELAGEIFSRYSFDLIYARPNQTIEQWERELKEALKLAGTHLSLYQLTIEKGTPFYSAYNSKKFSLPNEDLGVELYNITQDIMEDHGLPRYEISNHAVIGHECKHNLNYWQCGDYLGIGAGAHGRYNHNNQRIATMMIHNPENWLKSVQEKGDGMQSKAYLTENEILEEILLMGLRIPQGISKDRFKELLGNDIEEVIPSNKLKALQDHELIENDAAGLRATKKGMNLLNKIVESLF